MIEASPLPETIRVVDAEYSPDPMADQDAGDIIKVRRVEVQEHPERGRERVNLIVVKYRHNYDEHMG